MPERNIFVNLAHCVKGSVCFIKTMNMMIIQLTNVEGTFGGLAISAAV